MQSRNVKRFHVFLHEIWTLFFIKIGIRKIEMANEPIQIKLNWYIGSRLQITIQEQIHNWTWCKMMKIMFRGRPGGNMKLDRVRSYLGKTEWKGPALDDVANFCWKFYQNLINVESWEVFPDLGFPIKIDINYPVWYFQYCLISDGSQSAIGPTDHNANDPNCK